MDLVLNSLVLGISILGEGGRFVSKVFRGKDIRHLAFIISQFFDTILIAKPRVCRQSSCGLSLTTLFYFKHLFQKHLLLAKASECQNNFRM